MRTLQRIGLLSILLSAGCAGIPPAQVGQTAGTIVGNVLAPGIGAPVGALLGTLAGLVVQGEVDKATEKRERKELGEKLAVGGSRDAERAGPSAGAPVRVWVDEALHDGRLVAGHFDARYPVEPAGPVTPTAPVVDAPHPSSSGRTG